MMPKHLNFFGSHWNIIRVHKAQPSPQASIKKNTITIIITQSTKNRIHNKYKNGAACYIQYSIRTHV